jgi:hypothetical protein
MGQVEHCNYIIKLVQIEIVYPGFIGLTRMSNFELYDLTIAQSEFVKLFR